ncbi:MAG: hypothetical protein GY841_08145 [FCB group bacterium]|nr:hypothetical protein [FCB group bacterium]
MYKILTVIKTSSSCGRDDENIFIPVLIYHSISGCAGVYYTNEEQSEITPEAVEGCEVIYNPELIDRRYSEIDEITIKPESGQESETETISRLKQWAVSQGAEALILYKEKVKTRDVPGVAGGWFPVYETFYTGIAIEFY